MEFRVLGPLEVRREGRLIDVRGSKRRAVLALLVLQANEVVRTDRLIEDLWSERQPANASAALHNHVSRLRKDLGADVLVTKPWGYVLRAAPEAIDLRRFESIVAEARPLPARERSAKLGQALALWRGPALADLANEPVLAAELGRLEELRQSVVEQRIDARLELGEHAEVVRELERLIGEHPLRERLRGQLILALYRSGRQAEALETYRETRRVLVEELGIEPSPELRELERAILRQDPALASVRAPSEPEPPAQEIPPSRWRWPRSPLMVGAAVLVGLAGAALAILATPRSGTPHASAAKAPRSEAAVTKSASTSNEEPVLGTKKKRHRLVPTQESRRPRKQTAHSSTGSRVATTTKKQSQPATAPQPARQQPPAEKPKPKPKPKPNPPPPAVYWLADDFADPAFDQGMWHLASHGQGVDVAERNGRVEFSIAPDAVLDPEYGVDQHYGTNCLLIGDFEASVEFELLVWPAADAVNVTFGVYFPRPYRGVGWLAVERAGGHSDGTPEAYDSNIAYGAGARTDDRSGALRLRRKNGTLTTYYRYRGTWVSFGSKHAPLPANVVLNFNAGGNPIFFGRQTAAAAFDNFSATADGVNCGSYPLPPRKRRQSL